MGTLIALPLGLLALLLSTALVVILNLDPTTTVIAGHAALDSRDTALLVRRRSRAQTIIIAKTCLALFLFHSGSVGTVSALLPTPGLLAGSHLRLGSGLDVGGELVVLVPVVASTATAAAGVGLGPEPGREELGLLLGCGAHALPDTAAAGLGRLDGGVGAGRRRRRGGAGTSRVGEELLLDRTPAHSRRVCGGIAC